ncbi:hypothetical protein E4U42_007064 [Claviceps africana]|uniref:Uncharacterized protein n=1 Tax=Claviceps africana TaxID=83212 RepID=A0A8K0J2G4_9HYPO|nr:hypothetical protein E4U42_007064 [Claviceps africana]
MDGQFVSVRTWQGSIMVSTSLLPQSFDERTYYPNTGTRSDDSRESDTLPRQQHRSNSHMMTATSPSLPLPPVPDYWRHGPQAAAVGGAGSGNGFELDGHFSYAPSSPFDSAASSFAQTYSPTYTPRTDDDAASIPDAYPLFPPWETTGAGFSHHPPGNEWGDTSFATDPNFFPAAQCYCSAPAINMPAPGGMVWRDDCHGQGWRHETHFSPPATSSERSGSMKRPGTNFGSVF